jgi:hypothetical protein
VDKLSLKCGKDHRMAIGGGKAKKVFKGEEKIRQIQLIGNGLDLVCVLKAAPSIEPT